MSIDFVLLPCWELQKHTQKKPPRCLWLKQGQKKILREILSSSTLCLASLFCASKVQLSVANTFPYHTSGKTKSGTRAGVKVQSVCWGEDYHIGITFIALS